MTELISIELNREVAKTFLKDGYLSTLFIQHDINTLQLPAKKVELRLFNYLSSVEHTKKELKPLFEQANKTSRRRAEKILEDYVNSDILITYSQIDGKHLSVRVETLFTHEWFHNNLIFECRYVDGKCIIGRANIEESMDKVRLLALGMIGLLKTVLSHMNKQTVIKEVSNVRVTKTSNKKRSKNNKKTKVRYVYKTVYKIKGVNISSDKQTVKKSGKREFVKETWKRKGHYRTYRNKETGEVVKRIWIESTTCHASGKTKKEQQYKITKL